MQFKVPVLTEFIAPSSSSPVLEGPSSHHLWSLFPPGIGQSGEGRDQCISPSTALALSLCPHSSGHGGRAISVSSKHHQCPIFPAETLWMPPVSLRDFLRASLPWLWDGKAVVPSAPRLVENSQLQ